MRKITGEAIIIAQKATEHHTSQIQGFCYSIKDGKNKYFIRDLTKPWSEQVLWSAVSEASDYAFYHKEMRRKLEEFRSNLVAEVLNVMYGLQTSFEENM